MAPEALNFATNGRSTDEPAYKLAGVTGSTANVSTMKFDKALVEVVQLAPPVVVLKTPETVGSATIPIVFRSVRPVLTALQVPPPFAVLYTPLKVLAYTLLGAIASIARAVMSTNEVELGKVSPVLTAVQVVPAFVVLNTP